MYAVFVTGGKQYKAEEGDTLFIEKLDAAAEDTVVFDKVLLVSADGSLKTGTPYIDGAKVEAKVEKNGKGKKIRIFKYKAKSNYRKRQGHRQPFTKVTIEKIEA